MDDAVPDRDEGFGGDRALDDAHDGGAFRRADDVAARLAADARIDEPVAVVVAHPDDETLGAGSRLRRLRRLTLVHVTDGAPRNLGDARRAGYATAAEYAAQRRDELLAALRTLHATPRRMLACDTPDQQASWHLAKVARRLAEDLAGVHAVVTHAYEHGHPDHDATAFAVHAACALLRRAGAAAPAIVELAGYHLRDGDAVYGRFWPDPHCIEHVAPLTARQRQRKADALACFATQREVIARFPLGERFRAAPVYDFTVAAPPGAALYDRIDWGMAADGWREHAAEAIAALGLTPAPWR